MNEPARFSRPYKRFVCLARHMIRSTEQRNQIFVQQEHCHAEDKSESTLSALRHARGKAPTRPIAVDEEDEVDDVERPPTTNHFGARFRDPNPTPDQLLVGKKVLLHHSGAVLVADCEVTGAYMPV